MPQEETFRTLMTEMIFSKEPLSVDNRQAARNLHPLLSGNQALCVRRSGHYDDTDE